MAPDPAKRLEAAQAVLKSRDAGALAALDQAIDKETDARVKRALIGARAAVVLYRDRCIRCRQDRRRRRDPRSRRSGRARAARRVAGERLAGREEGGGRRHRLDPGQSRDLDRGAKRLVRALARLGAAAGRHRPRHHLRRDGRHQHGARRDGHDRRLHHVRRAGGDPRPQSRAVRLFARHCHSARLRDRRPGRHPDRARHHPLPLRAAARDPARHLGTVADPAAGGAHRLRSDQQGRRHSVLDVRLVRARTDHHHLQPAVDHRVHAAHLRRAAGRCCASRGSVSRCAR